MLKALLLVFTALLSLTPTLASAEVMELIQARQRPSSHGVKSVLIHVRVEHPDENKDNPYRSVSNIDNQVTFFARMSDGSMESRPMTQVSGGETGPATYKMAYSYGACLYSPCPPAISEFWFKYDYTRTAHESGHSNRLTDTHWLSNDNNNYQFDGISGVNGKTWQRTVVFVYGETRPGQDMFVRGGIDHNYGNSTGRYCTTDNFECAIGILHANFFENQWRPGDQFLDWYGNEAGQDQSAEGSPAAWTTNYWPGEWGSTKYVSVHGYGQSSLNTWGHHHWMLDVWMDCDATENGWFEVKSYISNGPSWEPDLWQGQNHGEPYSSGNHFGQCGKVNKFVRGSNSVEIKDLPYGYDDWY